ncbi:MAG: dihydroorotase [Bacteroidetes bacterium]|nr:dihydroorotase [Bacteroidota bacterium]
MEGLKLLIKKVQVIDSNSPYNGQLADILIEGNRVTAINQIPKGTYDKLEGNGLYLSPGWIDMRVNCCEPGMEHKEDIASACEAALHGGFCKILAMPTTLPVADNKATIQFMINAGFNKHVTLLPAGSITMKQDGKELAEMLDMKHGGAVAFTDYKNSVTDALVMKLALTYSKNIETLIMHHPLNKSLSNHSNCINESANTMQLGFKGSPALAEALMLQRDIELLSYTGGRLHVCGVSCKESVEMIAQAKARGLSITCDVCIHNLILDDSKLAEFDSNYKVNPPLRSTGDIVALIQGVNDDTIDAIVSDHSPQDIESKKVEFEFASPGMIGTQILFALYNTYLSDTISLEKFIQKITHGPSNILSLTENKLEMGQEAVFTIFQATDKWTFDAATNKSKSNNSPFINKELKGKAVAIINKGKLVRVD